MTYSPVLIPVVALVAWTLVMWIWMYAVRIPAMRRAGLLLDNRSAPGNLDGKIEPEAQWKAHNYNHLMEQPTLFYAVAIALAMLNDQDPMTAKVAGAYVAFRVLHSLVQATVNIVRIRLALFALSSLCLLLLTLRLLKGVIMFSGA